MEEDECAQMLDHLQQYVPHLEKLIAQLKDPKRKNRELQLNKLEGLHTMITDRKKKLKLDTLRKCEDVILKILHKVHPNIYKQFQPKPEPPQLSCNMVKFLCKDPPERTPIVNFSKESVQDNAYVRFQAARARLSEITTPASPSPPRDIPLVHKPIVIPTEQVRKLDSNPDDFQITNWQNTFDVNERRIPDRHYIDHYKPEKPDVYSQAGESLSSPNKKIVFDRLGTKVDMSKPPLSAEDLELLTSPDRDIGFDSTDHLPMEDSFSLDQLQDLRQVLQKKLQQSEERMNMPDLRNKLNSKEGTSKYKDKEKEKEKKGNITAAPLPVPPPAVTSKPRSPRVEKVYKNPDSIFGNLLSSIDEKILGDVTVKKKDPLKAEKNIKPDSKNNEKDSKKSSSKKEHHSHDRRDSHSKEKKSHRDEKHHKKDKSSSSSKDKESEKHKSNGSEKDKDKSKETKSEEKSSKHREENKEHGSNSKLELSTILNNHSKSADANGASHKTETKEAPVYKRLADKYNPRPRKNSIETADKLVKEDSRTLVDTGQKLPIDIFNLNAKDISTSSNDAIPIDPRQIDPRQIDLRQTDPRQIDPRQIDPRQIDPRQIDPRQINDPRQAIVHRQANDPRHLSDPRQMNEPKQINDPRQNSAVQWFEPNSPNFEMEKPSLLGRSPLLRMIPQLQKNSVIGSPFLQPPSAPNMQIGFSQSNPVNRQKEVINQFVSPQQNIMNQNISSAHGGNTYMNTFILQNNVSSNISHTQFNNPLNPSQNSFHGSVGPSKAFHPYDPIDVGEYDLSKMQPTDFYSPTFSKIKRPLLSPPPTPSYPNRGPYSSQFPSRERPSHMGRPNESWSSESKNQWQYAREREESQRPMPPSRDPRIRARELKDRNERSNYTHSRESPSSVQSRRKSVDEHTFFATQNKYDSLYSNLDRPKEKETFISPLDSLYNAGEERSQKTGKGYGVQKFRIPKKKNTSVDRPIQKDEKDGNRDVHAKDISEEKNEDQEKYARNSEAAFMQEENSRSPSREIGVPTQKDNELHEESRPSSETNKEKESGSQKDEDTSAASTSEVKKNSEDTKASPSDESMLANFLTKLITKSEKKELLSAIFSTLTDTISDQQKKKFKRIQKIVDSDSDDEKEETEEKTKKPTVKPAISEDDVQPKEEPQPVDDTKIKTKDNEEEEEEAEDEEGELTESTTGTTETTNDSEEKVETIKVQSRKVTQKKGRNKRRPLKKIGKKGKAVRSKKLQRACKKKPNTNNKKAEPKSPENVDDSIIETVGERIKNRRRNVKTPETPKLRKCRTELDMLHDDIKEMFIRDGVLTATGKRMCRMLKPESEADSNASKLLKTRSNTSLDEETTSLLDSPKRRARASNPKVVIEKTDLTKLATKPADESGSEDESIEARFLRRSKSRTSSVRNRADSGGTASDLSLSPVRRKRSLKSKPNYIEDTDEEARPQLSESEEELVKDTLNEPETAEPPSEPPVVSKEVTPNKKSSKKKKRGQNWASGIINKRSKKKPSSNSATPTPSLDGDQHSVVSDLDESLDTALQDDNDSEIEYIEPDANYYFDPHDKAVCKICQFKGKMIVQHYKTAHPKHEVLISRISPENAKNAIEEALEKGFDDIEVPDAGDAKIRRKKFTYQCRFCQVFFKNESSELFFDHVTSHTGEYRFICSFCSFKTANSKSLRSHFHTSHNANLEKAGLIMPAYSAPPEFHLMFGYMCGECNFIQMDKQTVITHVKIYHLGDNQKIYKINMSMIEVKPTLQTSEGTTKAITEKYDEEKQKPSDVPVANENEQISSDAKTKPAQKIPEDIPITDENEIPSQPEDINQVPAVPIKEDPTVFKYNGDYVQENMILEEQKHEKMKEITLSIVPKKKFTSNLLDKIKSRLDDKIAEAANSSERTTTEDSAFEEATSAVLNDNLDLDDANVKILKKSISTENAEAKKLKLMEPKISLEHNLEKPINNKNSVPITNIIERLQGKLNVDNVQPPPLIPLNEFNINLLEPKTEDIVIQVGPVAASKKNSYILYICYMQSCMFSSTSQSEFQVHCTTLHSNEGWDGFCNVCNSKVGSFEVVSAFKHLVNVHENELRSEDGFVIKTEPKEAENPMKSYIRMRRLSGDKLSEVHSENSESSSSDNKAFINETRDESKTFAFKIVDVMTEAPVEEEKVTEEPHNFPFQITNVISLAEDEAENSTAPAPAIVQAVNSPDKALPGLTIITSTANLASANIASTGIATSTTTATTSIAFQLPLQTTSGTGYSIVLPVLAPISKSLIPVGKLSPSKVSPPARNPVKPILPSTLKSYSNVKSQLKVPPKKIMLKDTPLHPEEMVKPRKSQAAMNSLLADYKIINLYKCPERNCTFSTDSKKPFEAHLSQHPEFKPGKLVPCLYCNFKTDIEYFGVHYDIRHGRCQFCCSYCLYRAINQSYVEMHQERQHSGKPRRVLMVALNQDALMSQAQIQMPPLQSVIPLYMCGQLGCECKFIFPENFKDHLATVHKGIPLLCPSCQWCPTSPENAVTHMQTHSIYYYHCRYCTFGAASTDDIYKHLANLHFALSPRIVLRQFVRDISGKSASEYSCKDPLSFERMKIISDENFKYVTSTARFEVIPVQEGKLKRPVKNLPVTATLSPVSATCISPKSPTELNKKKPTITLKILEQHSSTAAVVEPKKDSVAKPSSKENDSDIEILSDEETPSTSSVKPLNPLQVVAKSLASTARSRSPIVLNKYLKSPDLMALTQSLPSSSKGATAREESVAKTSKETITESKEQHDYIVIQPLLDEPLLDMRMETTNTTRDDIDPLQLDSEPCTAIPEETNTDVPTFTEAKLDVMPNFGFSEDGAVQEFADLTAEEASFSADETTKKQGLMGRDLFRCGFCRAGFETSSLFKTHVTKCVEINKNGIPRPFKCAHCVKAFKSLGTLSDHVRLHGTLRFSCSLCDFKHQHQLYVRSHLKNRHKITSVILTPVDPNKRCLDEDEFVVRPKITRQRSFEGSAGSKDSTGSGAVDETVTNRPSKGSYGPDEIACVPIRPIFSKEIKCSACGYLTKVRANLIRHLQFHTTGKEMPVSIAAPINPVPCLEKNEKMFDKMTNLSLSSYKDAIRMASKVEKQEKLGLSKEEEAQLPGFVPITKRYVCGASYCDYLCLEESMLRYHLLALHTSESYYKCLHCEEKLSSEKGVINVEFIIKHLRLHDLHLYKCRYCKFLHHLKHKVDRHVLDKHADKPPVVIIVRELEQEPEEPQEHEEIKETKETRPWRCGMCKYRCSNKNEIVLHVFNKHDVEIQFKCALCQFTSHKKSSFSDHFESDHPGQNIDVIDAYYEVEETVSVPKTAIEGTFFDTTPLWQRDKNKFKHIRGIPLDESKFLKKSPIKVPNSSDNLDRAIEAVASGVAEVIEKDVKNPLAKKPKTLKEKKMEIKINSENDVIEIDDDEEKNVAVKAAGVAKALFARRMSETAKPSTAVVKENESEEKLVEVTRRRSVPELIAKPLQREFIEDEDKIDISLKEIEEMDIATLKTTDLSGTYGPFGKPSFKQFLCPLCSTFKTKKVQDITHHLYKELHYFRYVCTNCALTGITYSFLHKHSLKKHLTESIHPVSPNPRIEEWVQKVLTIQRRIIAANETATAATSVQAATSAKNVGKVKKTGNNDGLMGETAVQQAVATPTAAAKEINLPDSSSNSDTEGLLNKGKQTPAIHQCQHCNYSCKAASDLRKHEKRHWVQKPLKCGHCDIEGVTKYEVIQHARRAHPNLEPLVIPVPMPSTPTIKPITRKRKYPKSAWDNVNSSSAEETPTKCSGMETSEGTKESSPLKQEQTDSEKFVFVCKHCSKPFDTKSELKLHWESAHKTKLSLFKFKKVLRGQLEEIGDSTESSLFEEDAESESEDLVVFICNYCPKRCSSESETRAHWESTHKVKQPAFKYKKLMRSQLLKKGALNYKCTYCDFIGHLEVVKKHFIMKHPNLGFSVYRYKCGYCGHYLKNMDKAKIHCKQVHGDAEPSYKNIGDPGEEAKEPEKPKDFVCEYCSIEFEFRKELVDHHKALHSHLELNLPPDLTAQSSAPDEGDELKTYMCPQCQHASNSYAAMRDHLRNHAKPYQCYYCPTRFTYPSLVRSHHQKDHPDTEYKYNTIDEANKMNENLRKNLLVLTKDGVYEKISLSKGPKRPKVDQGNQARKIRVVEGGLEPPDVSLVKPSDVVVDIPGKAIPTARKSTTQGIKRPIDEGFSYYGNKPDLSGLENVRTTVSFMESMVTMNVAQLRGFLDISPTVPVVDIMKYKDEL